MIDTIECTAPIAKRLLVAIRADIEGTPEMRYPSVWKRVKSPFGSFKITIKLKENTIDFKLSPMKYLKGHNFVGTNNLELLIVEIMKMVYDRFNVSFTEKDKAFYTDNDSTMLRGDFNGNFLVGSQAKVVNTMELIREHLLAHGHDIVVHEGPNGIETIYEGKNSSHSTIKFYNKYLEMLAKSARATKALPYYSELLKYAKKVVRFEVTLRSNALEGETVKDGTMKDSTSWSPRKQREILVNKLVELQFSRPLIVELPPETIAGLKPDKRRKYEMWFDGVPSKKYYSPKTNVSDSKFFLELGLDIARSRSKTLDAVTLSSRISVAKLKMNYPTRLVGMGAILKKSK